MRVTRRCGCWMGRVRSRRKSKSGIHHRDTEDTEMSRHARVVEQSGRVGNYMFQAAYLGTSHSLDGSEAADRTEAGVGATTSLIRVATVGAASRIAIGGADVEATAADAYLPADSVEYFGIDPGQYVSVLGGECCVTECG